jgi:UrcA family protein
MARRGRLVEPRSRNDAESQAQRRVRTELNRRFKEMTMYRFTTLTMILALALIHQSANADPAQVNVRFSDLDLTRAEGAAVLYHRLRQAAKTVCTPLEGRGLATAKSFKDCVQSGIEGAVMQVNRPMLTAYYRALTGNGAIQVAAK